MFVVVAVYESGVGLKGVGAEGMSKPTAAKLDIYASTCHCLNYAFARLIRSRQTVSACSS